MPIILGGPFFMPKKGWKPQPPTDDDRRLLAILKTQKGEANDYFVAGLEKQFAEFDKPKPRKKWLGLF